MTKKWKNTPLTEHVICECGYHNQPWNVEKYATCKGCGKTLNSRNKFKREMYNRLRLWRNNK